MDKLKEAIQLAEKLLESCSCNKDQVKIAQQKDTLLDNNERIVKDKEDKETHLNPEPTTEAAKQLTKNQLFKMKRGMGREKYQKEQRSKKRDRVTVEGNALIDAIKKRMEKNKKSVGNTVLSRKEQLKKAMEG